MLRLYKIFVCILHNIKIRSFVQLRFVICNPVRDKRTPHLRQNQSPMDTAEKYIKTRKSHTYLIVYLDTV